VNESVNIEAEKPNNRAALDAGWPICLHIGHDWSGHCLDYRLWFTGLHLYQSMGCCWQASRIRQEWRESARPERIFRRGGKT